MTTTPKDTFYGSEIHRVSWAYIAQADDLEWHEGH